MPNLKARWRDIIWHRKLKKRSTLLKELAKLKVWLSCQLSAPVLWADDQENQGPSLSSPGVFALVVSLVSKGGISLDTAWNMRISEARWHDVTLAEIGGAKLKIAYEGEEEEIKQQLTEISDEQAIELAKRNLSENDFKRWLESFNNKK